MSREEEICRAHIEALTEELARIPAAEHNRRKIQDRETQLAFYKRTLDRLERTHEAFIDRRRELLARCREFAAMQH